MNYPLISVIIPTIGRDTLKRTLKSILVCQYPNLEIIVSANNCKWEKIQSIFYSINHYPFNLIHTEEKLIPSQAKNKALEKATGKYVTFLDDDDTALLEKLFNLSAYLETHLELSAVFGQYNVRDCYTGEIKNTNCGGNDNVCFDTLIKNNYIASGSIMYRNNSFIYFDEEIDFGEDWMMNLRLLGQFFKIGYLPFPVYCWTQNLEDGYTATYRKKGINWQKLVQANKQKAIEKWGSNGRI